MSAHGKGVQTAVRTAPVKGKAALLETLSGLGPEQVAFLGECAAKNVFVQVLCWPTIPAAWSMLTEATVALRAIRDGLSMSAPVSDTSWVQHVAPQLNRPLERESGAAESTLATLIGRLPVQFAVAIVEQELGERQGADVMRYRSLFSGCLTAYDTFLKASRQRAVRIMIAPSQGDARNDLRSTVYGEMLPHMDGAERLDAIELVFWPKGTPPLPMEVAQLAAAAVARHLLEPSLANPLFETVRAHLAPPSRFHALGGRTGRR